MPTPDSPPIAVRSVEVEQQAVLVVAAGIVVAAMCARTHGERRCRHAIGHMAMRHGAVATRPFRLWRFGAEAHQRYRRLSAAWRTDRQAGHVCRLSRARKVDPTRGCHVVVKVEQRMRRHERGARSSTRPGQRQQRQECSATAAIAAPRVAPPLLLPPRLLQLSRRHRRGSSRPCGRCRIPVVARACPAPAANPLSAPGAPAASAAAGPAAPAALSAVPHRCRPPPPPRTGTPAAPAGPPPGRPRPCQRRPVRRSARPPRREDAAVRPRLAAAAHARLHATNTARRLDCGPQARGCHARAALQSACASAIGSAPPRARG
eukprot:365679-Chlamydomonas_euryale.AAC.4